MRRSDAGFTLVELLIAIVIIGIITVPLGNVIISYLRNSDQTNAWLSESHDVQIAAAYFSQDVASVGVRGDDAALVQSIETNAPAAGGLYPCGTTGTALVRFAWDQYTVGSDAPEGLLPTTVVAAYVVTADSGRNQLHRVYCDGSTAVTSDVVLVHNLDSVSVTCEPTDCTAYPNVPERVKLQLTVKAPGSTDSPYTITLTGQRRQT